MERRDDQKPTRRTQNDDKCHQQNAGKRFRIKDLLTERNKRKKRKENSGKKATLIKFRRKYVKIRKKKKRKKIK